MVNKMDSDAEERSISWLRKLLIYLGSIFVMSGIVGQWPIAGKTYMEFIQGDGYLSLMLGLIMILLGISARLLIGQEKE